MTMEEKNRQLIEKYPFLAFKSYDFDNDVYFIPEDYNYSSTWFDAIPEGWAKAFGEDMCREIKEALDEFDYTDRYIITDVKEKYGSLRIYDNGIPCGCKVWDVIEKYARLSEVTCISCGKPATKISLGWICPWCDDCAKDIKGKFADINYEDNKCEE